MTEKNYPFLTGGGEMSSLIAAYGWSKTALGSIETWPQNLRATVSLMLKSRFPMLVFWGPELVTFYNDAFRPSLGDDGKHPGSLGQRGEDSWAESWPVIGPMIYNIMAGGDAVWFEDQKLPLYRDGKMGYAYWTYSFSPIDDGDGNVAGLLVTCAETTKAVESVAKFQEANNRLQESLELVQTMIESTPFPIGVYIGRELRIRFANQSIKEIFGKGDEVEGKLYTDILPELANQEIFEQLRSVYDTGIAFHSGTRRVDIEHGGVLVPYYFNYSFTPLLDAAGKVYGVMNTAADVTELEVSRSTLAEKEATLRDAIELAELATWTIDVSTGKATYSERMQGWLSNSSTHSDLDNPLHVHPDDLAHIGQAIREAIKPGSSGIFDETYKVTGAHTGTARTIHAIGQSTFDESGNAVRLSGTAQDITMQRDLQAALEQEVQIRTEELAAAVEELRATNEELENANEQLVHSNEELAQYAYVASHDLQEPLRKIRVFSGLLGNSSELSEKNRGTVEKIRGSAERMSMLIQDLLTFSKLLKSETLMRPVALKDVVMEVWNDFELVVSETEATISVAEMPMIEAVSLQMNQLFYNLIGNALKFTMPGRTPHISISSRIARSEELKGFSGRTLPFATYHHIMVADNGIGFEAKYNEQIFEVFKRLHGRDHYPGSGIGLAVCRRVAANHNGHLYAVSETGKGSTFHILLPDRQENAVSQYEGLASMEFTQNN